MAFSMTFQTATPVQRQSALKLLYQLHLPEEAEIRIANTIHLLETGRLDPESLFIIQEEKWVTGVLLCLKIPGAMALLWPPQVQGGPLAREREKLLAQRSTAWLRGRGVKIAQVLLFPGELHLAASLLENGFQHVTRVNFLKHDPGLPLPNPEASRRLTFLSLDQVEESLFSSTLQQTYIDTQDIPELCGLRTPLEIMLGHQSQGKFDPGHWWLAFHQGKPAGVLLLTDFPETAEWDLSYLGLIPSLRRMGMGKEIVLQGLRFARNRGAAGMTVSVDVRNLAACRLYASLGFCMVEEREIVLGLWPA